MKQDYKQSESKRPSFDTGWLVYKGEGLPKLPTLTGGRLCKVFLLWDVTIIVETIIMEVIFLIIS